LIRVTRGYGRTGRVWRSCSTARGAGRTYWWGGAGREWRRLGQEDGVRWLVGENEGIQERKRLLMP